MCMYIHIHIHTHTYIYIYIYYNVILQGTAVSHEPNEQQVQQEPPASLVIMFCRKLILELFIFMWIFPVEWLFVCGYFSCLFCMWLFSSDTPGPHREMRAPRQEPPQSPWARVRAVRSRQSARGAWGSSVFCVALYMWVYIYVYTYIYIYIHI